MRPIGLLLLLLLTLGWLGRELPGAANPSQQPTQGQFEAGWRRTIDGWEQTDHWAPEVAFHRPALHPVLVGLLEILLSLVALVALANDGQSRDGQSRRLAGIGRFRDNRGQ